MTTPARTAHISVRGPFELARAIEMLSGWEPAQRHAQRPDGVLRLAFPLDGAFTPTAVAVRTDGDGVAVEVSGTDDLDAAAGQVARILSLDHDARDYSDVGRRDPAVGALMEILPGLRPVNFSSPYEAACWAVLSQRISMRQAAGIQKRIVAEHGRELTVAGEPVHCFPTPAALLGADALPSVPPTKAERMRAIARAALDGRLDAQRLRVLGDERAPAALRELPGIGAFWSAGIYLRSCGIRDAFPPEPICIAALGALHGAGDRPDTDTVRAITEPLRPYRMWVCFLLRVAAGKGLLPGISGRESEIRRGAA
ncbi:MAG: DNA-3-methyladenine glycosylase family protein [Mycobacteriales bacterium]